MADYEITRAEDIDEIDDGRSPFRPVRHRLGITAFGANAFGPRQAGERLINEHDEGEPDFHEELYVVLHGRARFEIGGETVETAQGSLVYVRPGVTRTAFAEEDGTTLLVIGAKAGEPYKPMGYEYWAPLQPLYEAGDYAAVAERGKEMLTADPPHPMLFYNVACAESLAGRSDDAIVHLQRAKELAGDISRWAKEDSDLDPLRGDPRFEELIS